MSSNLAYFIFLSDAKMDLDKLIANNQVATALVVGSIIFCGGNSSTATTSPVRRFHTFLIESPLLVQVSIYWARRFSLLTNIKRRTEMSSRLRFSDENGSLCLTSKIFARLCAASKRM